MSCIKFWNFITKIRYGFVHSVLLSCVSPWFLFILLVRIHIQISIYIYSYSNSLLWKPRVRLYRIYNDDFDLFTVTIECTSVSHSPMLLQICSCYWNFLKRSKLLKSKWLARGYIRMNLFFAHFWKLSKYITPPPSVCLYISADVPIITTYHILSIRRVVCFIYSNHNHCHASCIRYIMWQIYFLKTGLIDQYYFGTILPLYIASGYTWVRLLDILKHQISLQCWSTLLYLAQSMPVGQCYM